MAKVGRRSIEWNSDEFAKILKSSGVADVLRRKAEAVAAQAISTAPVRSGDYQSSIHVEMVAHPTRTVARVVADVDYAWVVEARTGNLARALDAAGGA